VNGGEGLSKYFILILTVIFAGSALAGGRPKVKEGNKYYAQGKFDQALNKYQDALIDNPESPEIHFNIGDALYKKKKYEEALKSYQKALATEDALLQSKAYYNIGNTLYRLGRLPESILAYKKALEINPNDMDAKYNLEFVRNKLKQNLKKQPMTGQQQQQVQQQPQVEQGKEQKDEQKDEQQKQGKSEKRKQEMSKEEAERILDALKRDEEKLQKRRRIKVSGSYKVDKDW